MEKTIFKGQILVMGDDNYNDVLFFSETGEIGYMHDTLKDKFAEMAQKNIEIVIREIEGE